MYTNAMGLFSRSPELSPEDRFVAEGVRGAFLHILEREIAFEKKGPGGAVFDAVGAPPLVPPEWHDEKIPFDAKGFGEAVERTLAARHSDSTS